MSHSKAPWWAPWVVVPVCCGVGTTIYFHHSRRLHQQQQDQQRLQEKILDTIVVLARLGPQVLEAAAPVLQAQVELCTTQTNALDNLITTAREAAISTAARVAAANGGAAAVGGRAAVAAVGQSVARVATAVNGINPAHQLQAGDVFNGSVRILMYYTSDLVRDEFIVRVKKIYPKMRIIDIANGNEDIGFRVTGNDAVEFFDTKSQFVSLVPYAKSADFPHLAPPAYQEPAVAETTAAVVAAVKAVALTEWTPPEAKHTQSKVPVKISPDWHRIKELAKGWQEKLAVVKRIGYGAPVAAHTSALAEVKHDIAQQSDTIKKQLKPLSEALDPDAWAHVPRGTSNRSYKVATLQWEKLMLELGILIGRADAYASTGGVSSQGLGEVGTGAATPGEVKIASESKKQLFPESKFVLVSQEPSIGQVQEVLQSIWLSFQAILPNVILNEVRFTFDSKQVSRYNQYGTYAECRISAPPQRLQQTAFQAIHLLLLAISWEGDIHELSSEVEGDVYRTPDEVASIRVIVDALIISGTDLILQRVGKDKTSPASTILGDMSKYAEDVRKMYAKDTTMPDDLISLIIRVLNEQPEALQCLASLRNAVRDNKIVFDLWRQRSPPTSHTLINVIQAWVK